MKGKWLIFWAMGFEVLGQYVDNESHMLVCSCFVKTMTDEDAVLSLDFTVYACTVFSRKAKMHAERVQLEGNAVRSLHLELWGMLRWLYVDIYYIHFGRTFHACWKSKLHSITVPAHHQASVLWRLLFGGGSWCVVQRSK